MYKYCSQINSYSVKSVLPNLHLVDFKSAVCKLVMFLRVLWPKTETLMTVITLQHYFQINQKCISKEQLLPYYIVLHTCCAFSFPND